MKIGINIFTSEQLTLIFEHYHKILNSDNNLFRYREFVNLLYNVDVTRKRIDPKIKENLIKKRGFTNNPYDKEENIEIKIQKIIEYILFRIRKLKIYDFLLMYNRFCSQENIATRIDNLFLK